MTAKRMVAIDRMDNAILEPNAPAASAGFKADGRTRSETHNGDGTFLPTAIRVQNDIDRGAEDRRQQSLSPRYSEPDGNGGVGDPRSLVRRQCRVDSFRSL